MKLTLCLKWSAITCATLAIAVVAEARSFGNGFFKDSSGNLYTASYYPTSLKLRVSKRTQANASVWCHDITPPAGFRFGANHIIRFDGSGNIYIGTAMSNSTTSISQLAVYKLTSAGAVTASAFYAPAPAGTSAGISGCVLDSSGNVYIAGSYGSSPPVGFVRKYNSSLGSPVTRGFSIPGYNAVVNDLVADGSGNVYSCAIGANGILVASTVCKWDSTFPASPTWQQTYNLGANALPSSTTASLTIDSSSNVTFVGQYHDTNYSNTNIYAVQYNSSGTQNWANQPGLPGMSSYWSILDASGDIVVAGTTSSTNYQIAKFNGSTGAVTWSTTRPGSGVLPIVCQDASGDYLVVTAQTSGSAMVSVVDRFAGATGAYTTNYTYSSGATGQDYGQSILPSSTAGTFFVFGTGLSGGSYYPLIYRAGTSPWTVYQTAVIP